MSESVDRVEALFKGATENNLLEDPERIRKLYDEAERRWRHLMTRHGLGDIVTFTLLTSKLSASRARSELL